MIKVMIAEDQELIRQSLEFVISNKEDMKIVGLAATGKEAVELAKDKKPDVILMDIRMPEMDGVEATKVIKKMNPDIKIIILTTFDDDEYVFDALKNGASGYLLKGISLNELVESIRIVMNGGSLINPSVATKVCKFFSQMAEADYTSKIQNDALSSLNKNELKIMKLIGMGLSNKEITKELNFSEGTVRNYISNILSKLNLRDRTQIAILAVQSGITMGNNIDSD
ncbi:response regulator transcription factor [Defluviitalea raffinosedens]|uniref:Stage 0 sporulation protein A homolog n=1 Tax=Defluviitalea raffinosedens TaxID=1450156 RepID=A0A7C8LTU6_9FIRM|nr:response regulator transcription factor [Defluviitalea raffinosedens]KAE9635470.1 response regulator [Defluviitalea raffinosedens]MBM7684379.1 DNA-binding NarL/FixJ family response regulator [Defluviitalea raffinosedens]HHW67656.1 response regulator transcription factor [Candidatus Epulonipiscium sp.]